MTPYAVLIPVERRTRDHRTIRWWECELTDDHGSVRDQMHPFFSLDDCCIPERTERYYLPTILNLAQ